MNVRRTSVCLSEERQAWDPVGIVVFAIFLSRLSAFALGHGQKKKQFTQSREHAKERKDKPKATS
jgi:hypothetical protein